MSSIEIKTGPFVKPHDDARTKVIRMRDIVEVTTSRKIINPLSRYRRFGTDSYVDTQTGEVLPCKERTWSERITSFNRKLKELRRVATLNITGSPSERHIILTYSGIMTDREKAEGDFRRWWGRFRYRYPNCEYISVIAPEHTGSWQINCLIKNRTGDALHIDEDGLSRMWGHGQAWTRDILITDDYGSYFTNYLLETATNTDASRIHWSKRIAMNKTLRFYPAGFRLYNCSKGIAKPRAEIMSYREASEIVGDGPAQEAYTVHVVVKQLDGTEVVVNVHTHEQFNLERKG